MTSSNEQITKDHNLKSPAVERLIQESANRLAEIDSKRAELNNEAKEMREKLADVGILPQAFMSKYTQFKKMRRQKEGYTQSEEICFEALNKMDQRELFGWMDEADEKAKEEKEAKKAAKPKKSVGEQQAEAIMGANKAH